MKYCTHCKVNVNHQHDNCPLCGKYLDPANNNDNCTTYHEMDKTIVRPTISHTTKVNFLKTKFNKMMLALCIVCVIINMLFDPTSLWSAYVIVGTFMLIFSVIFPIVENPKISRQVKNNLYIVTLSAIAFELIITRFHFEWFVVFDILPWIYVAMLAFVDILIVFRRYGDRGLFNALIVTTIFAVIPQFINWISRAVGHDFAVGAHVPAIMISALLNIALVLIVCSRSLRESFERNMHN